jgi:transcriptional regulator with XRE-family HTH domain
MSTATKNHIGRKISRIRELRDMKQDVLAEALGVSQQTISNIENSEDIEPETLIKIAEVLGVTPEAIENFSEEAVFNILNNTFNDSTLNNNYLCVINPLEKIIELYERLVLAEKEKNAYLEKQLNDK